MDITKEIEALKARQDRVERILIGLQDARIEFESELSLNYDTKKALFELQKEIELKDEISKRATQ